MAVLGLGAGLALMAGLSHLKNSKEAQQKAPLSGSLATTLLPNAPLSGGQSKDDWTNNIYYKQALALNEEAEKLEPVTDPAQWLPAWLRERASQELQPFARAYGGIPAFLDLPVSWEMASDQLFDASKKLSPDLTETQADAFLQGFMRKYGQNHLYSQPNFVPQFVLAEKYPERKPRPIRMMVIDTSVQPDLKPGFMRNVQWHVLPGPGLSAQSSCLAHVTPWVMAHGSRVAWVASAAFWRALPNARLDIYNLPFTGGCEEQAQFAHFLQALDVAEQMHMDVVNISLALNERFLQDTCPRPLQERIDRLGKKGTLVVAAAGNLPPGDVYPPASCANLLVVGNEQWESATDGTNRDNYIYTQGQVQVPSWRWQATIRTMNELQKRSPWMHFQGTSASAGLASGVLASWLALQDPACKPTWKAVQARVRAASRTLAAPSEKFAFLQKTLSLKDIDGRHYPAARKSGKPENVRILDQWLLLGLAPEGHDRDPATLWPSPADGSLCAPLTESETHS